MLPILLPLEAPDSELKDNVARKLYKIIEELKAKQQAELTPVADTETKTTEAIPEAEIETKQDDDEDLAEEPIKFSLGDDSTLSESDLSSESSESTLDIEQAEQIVEDKRGKEKVEKIVDEKLERQRTMEYIQSYYKEETATHESAIKKTKLFSIILFVVSLILLAVVYFLLSSEISSNKEEIDNLKISFDDYRTNLPDNNLV